MLITIYDSEGNPKTELSPNDSSTQVKEVQGDSVLTLSFTHYDHIALDVDDYVDFEGERFWLTEKYRPRQNARKEWVYDIKLYGVESMLKRLLVIKTVDNEDEPVFTLTAPPREHVAMIVKCMNNGFGNITDWKVGQVNGTENIVIDYFGKYCDEALKEIAEKAGAEWWVEGQTVNVCKCEHGEAITMGYNNGLLSIDPGTADNVKFYTRLYPVGSSRNIDRDKYGYSRLRLPGGQKYVEMNADKYGRVDHYEQDAFADIYPRRTGVVSSVRSEGKKGEDGNPFIIYYFKDDSLTFDPNDYEIGGLVKRVSFQEGSELAGLGEEDNGTYYFEVNFNSKTREFEIITIWPYDNDMQLPGDKLIPKIGDKYILWNLRMPDEYYELAEAEFMSAVDKYNADHNLDISVYKAPTDHVWIEDNEVVLTVGQRVRLESEEYFPETGYRDSRITKITRKVNLPSSMDIEISDALSRTSMQKVSDSISEVRSYAEGIAGSVALPDIIRTGDKTRPTDNNLLSAKRSYADMLRKDRPDRTTHLLSSDKGFEAGNYQSGVSGGVFSIDSDGDSFAEVARLYVRVKAFFEELTIVKSNVLSGKQYITPGGGIKCTKVVETASTYQCYFLSAQDGEEARCKLMAGDQAICEEFNVAPGTSTKVTNHFYWRLVTDVTNDAYEDENGNHYGYIELSKTDCASGSDVPKEGDEICQFGYRNEDGNKERQTAMVFSTVESDSPSVKLFSGVNSYSTDGKVIISFGRNPLSGQVYFRLGASGAKQFLEYTQGGGLKVAGSISAKSTYDDGSNEEKILGDVMSDRITETDVLYIQIDSHTLKPQLPAVNSSGAITNPNGWTTTAPEWKDGMYMWQTTYVKKGDGSATFSDPTCISGARGQQGEQGIPGKDGENGKTSYFHIKYSSVANPTTSAQMTETPSTYIGTYVDYTETDSNDPKKYTWSRFEGQQGEDGSQGIPGKNGEDGKTSYLHIKYSNDGGKTFTPASGSLAIGETPGDYIGQYTDFTQADSNKVSDYKWAKIKGESGANGTSITISSQSVKYSTVHTATQPADNTFALNAVPTLSAGQYLWSMTTVTYSNGQSTKSYAVSRIGTNGTSVTITLTSVKYAKTSNTTQPADKDFTATSIETVGLKDGDYLWTKTEVTYSDGSNTKSYSVSRIGSDGEDGLPGSPGADGKATYVHFAYASGVTGNLPHPTSVSGFSTTAFDGAKYIGVCTDFNQADPTTNPQSTYEWSEYRGKDGNNAKSVTINGEQVFTYTDNFTSAATPTSITLTATLQNTTGYKWTYKREGETSFRDVSGGTSSTCVISANNTSYFPNGAKSCVLRCTSGGVYDEITIVKVSSGTNGLNYAPNLIKGANRKLQSTSYGMGGYNWDERPSAGTKCTITICACVGAKDTSIGIYQNGGYNVIGSFTSKTEEVKSYQFTVIDNASTPQTKIDFYHLPNDGDFGADTYVKWAVVTIGDEIVKAWVPASSEMVGEDGKDGYTVILSNENHTFEGDTTKAKGASTTSEIIAYKGATRVNATIGTVTGLPSKGMSTSLTSNGTTSAKFTVKVTDALTKEIATSGQLTIPITVDGKTFNRTFSWNLSLAGRGIVSVAEEYAISASATTAPANSEFSTSVPTMTDAKPYLWNREKTTYTDNTVETTNAVVIGVKGQNGVDGATIVSVTNYYLASAKASGVTKATSEGWKTDASQAVTDASKPYLWNYEVTKWSKGADTSTDPHVVGKFGKDGKTPRITEQYYLSTSSTQLLGGSWSDTKQTWVAGRYYWTRSKIDYGDGDVEYTEGICVTPENGTSVLAEYSADGTTWHPSFQSGDVWMHTSSDGGKTWSPAMRIVGSNYSDNLLLNSNFEKGEESWNKWNQPIINEIVELNGKKWAHVKTDAVHWQGYWQARKFVLKPNTKYTLSFLVKGTKSQQLSVMIHWDTSGMVILSQSVVRYNIDTTEKRIVLNLVSPNNADFNTISVMIGNGADAIATEMWFTEVKLEEGNNPDPQWTPAVSEMVGEDGKWRKFQWAKNTSTTTSPTSGWQDTPLTAPAGEYVWMRSGWVVPPATEPTTWETATRLTGDKGAKGDPGSPTYMLDLTDEVKGIACDASGNPIPSSIPTSQAQVWKGSTKLAHSSVTYSIAQATGITASVNNSTGVVTLSNFTADTATVVVQAVVDGVTLQSTISVYKVRPGGSYAPNLILGTKDVSFVASSANAINTSKKFNVVTNFKNFTAGTKLTLSFDYEYSQVKTQTNANTKRFGFQKPIKQYNNAQSYLEGWVYLPENSTGLSGKGTYHTVMTIPEGADIDVNDAIFYIQVASGLVTMKNFKIEEGANENPHWSPASSEMVGEDGADAVVYSIEPSVDNITKSMTGELSATSVTCSVYKTTGNSQRVLTSEKQVSYQVIKTDGSSVSGTKTPTNGVTSSVAVTADTEAIIWELKGDNNVVLDRERVPVLADASDLELGGRNLILKSGQGVTTASYLTKEFYLAEKPKVGDAYTFTLWGSLASTKTGFHIFNSGGMVKLGELKKVSDGIYQLTFKWINVLNGNTANDTTIRIYAVSSSQSGTSTISKVKLEKGNVGSDWSPAPEDTKYIEDALKDATTMNGGLILTSMVSLGQNNTDYSSQTTWSGISGIYDTKATGNGIALWFGGDMLDLADYYNWDNANGLWVSKGGTLPSRIAKGVDRMDGSGYRANGNLWWDKDGNVTFVGDMIARGEFAGIRRSKKTIITSSNWKNYMKEDDGFFYINFKAVGCYMEFQYLPSSGNVAVYMPENKAFVGETVVLVNKSGKSLGVSGPLVTQSSFDSGQSSATNSHSLLNGNTMELRCRICVNSSTRVARTVWIQQIGTNTSDIDYNF